MPAIANRLIANATPSDTTINAICNPQSIMEEGVICGVVVVVGFNVIRLLAATVCGDIIIIPKPDPIPIGISNDANFTNNLFNCFRLFLCCFGVPSITSVFKVSTKKTIPSKWLSNFRIGSIEEHLKVEVV